MEASPPYAALRYGTAVATPAGPAMVVARYACDDGERFLVSLGRSSFSEAEWLRLCPSGAPCTYKQYERSELK